MTVVSTPSGYEIRLTSGEAKILMEELGDLSSRLVKVRQLYRHLEITMRYSILGAEGEKTR